MAKQSKTQANNAILYIFAYLLTWLSGILMYITVAQTDKRMKFHSVQAILLGIVIVILWFIPIINLIGWLVWLYGMYVGYMAYTGKDLSIPVLGDFAKQYSK